MFRRLTISLVLSILSLNCLNASQTSFEFDMSGGPGLSQKAVFLTESEYQAKIPKKLSSIMALPKTKHEIMDPISLFDFSEEGSINFKSLIDSNIASVGQRFYLVETNAFKILKLEDSTNRPYLLTRNLCDCVAVSIYIEGVMAGLMHVGFKSFDDGIFDQYLAAFPKPLREKVQVTLISGLCSILVSHVKDGLEKNGFQVLSVDITPTYFENKARNGKSTQKYFSYERYGMNIQDALRLKSAGSRAIMNTINHLGGLNPRANEVPRLAILDSHTGKSHQFFEEGFFTANSNLLVEILGDKKLNTVLDPAMRKELMRSLLDAYLKKTLKTNLEISTSALIALGPEMKGLQQIIELSRQ